MAVWVLAARLAPHLGERVLGGWGHAHVAAAAARHHGGVLPPARLHHVLQERQLAPLHLAASPAAASHPADAIHLCWVATRCMRMLHGGSVLLHGGREGQQSSPECSWSGSVTGRGAGRQPIHALAVGRRQGTGRLTRPGCHAAAPGLDGAKIGSVQMLSVAARLQDHAITMILFCGRVSRNVTSFQYFATVLQSRAVLQAVWGKKDPWRPRAIPYYMQPHV
jgi:hypothetical protein